MLDRLRDALTHSQTICFESTGASQYFPWLVTELGAVAVILPVRVLADDLECLRRIRRRDASIHIPVPEDQVAPINARAREVELPWALEIDNRGPFIPNSVTRQIADLLTRVGASY